MRLRKVNGQKWKIAIVRVSREVCLLRINGEMAIVRVRKDVRLVAKSGKMAMVRVRNDFRLLGNGYSEGT